MNFRSCLTTPYCMTRTIFLLPALFYCLIVSAQVTSSVKETKAGDPASVNVIVTNMKGQASKGEQILFKGQATGAFFSGYSDASGKFSLSLPVGDKYMISVKSLTDSTKYGIIDIPVPEAGQFYTEPFKVEIQFEAARSYTLKNVHFDTGKASLRPDSYPALEELFSYLQHKENTRIQIAGHTDNVGNDTDNLKLSQQRAEAIRAYLVKRGILSSRLVAKGYGASQPVAGNETEEGRQQNRRTEIKIL